MGRVTKVRVLDKEYTVTYGPFGEMIINGMAWEEFWDAQPLEVIAALAKKGLETAKTDPKYFADAVDRLELNEELGWLKQ